jgi:hypothetical protein
MPYFHCLCCFCIMMSNSYCVVFLCCLSSSCLPYVVSFSGFSIFFIALLVFSNVYLLSDQFCMLKLLVNIFDTHFTNNS